MQLEQEERDLYKAFGLRLKGRNPATQEVLEWEWAKVKQIQDIINKREISYSEVAEAVGIASGRDDVLNWYWYDVFAAYNFIVKEIEAINTREQELAYEPDALYVGKGAMEKYALEENETVTIKLGSQSAKYKVAHDGKISSDIVIAASFEPNNPMFETLRDGYAFKRIEIIKG